MFLLSNADLTLNTSRIETNRCVLLPFSTDGRVDIREFQEEFCKANKNLWVAPYLPNYEEELRFVEDTEIKIRNGEEFENFIIDKRKDTLIGAGGLRILESGKINIGIWIRENRQGEGIATEVYEVLIEWARENTEFIYLKHSLNPENIGSRKLALKFCGILQEEKTESGHDVYHIPLRSFQ